MHLKVAHLFKRKVAPTRVKVKLSTVVSCVRLKVEMLLSHEPFELVRLGFRFITARTV